MVSLQDNWAHFCGGSLIAPDVVLTAGNANCEYFLHVQLLQILTLDDISYIIAHCEKTDSFLAVGRHHKSDDKEGKLVEIADFVPHEEFDFGGDNFDNDIMVLILDEAIEDIPIVKINSDSSVPEVHSPVTVTGWGDTDIDWLKFEMSDALKSAEVYVQV